MVGESLACRRKTGNKEKKHKSRYSERIGLPCTTHERQSSVHKLDSLVGTFVLALMNEITIRRVQLKSGKPQALPTWEERACEKNNL